MNIGLIIFSRTGNTLSVAEGIRDAFLAQGHAVDLELITAENENSNRKLPLRLTRVPSPVRYDTVVFGAPVQAFGLSPIMVAYLKQMPSIKDKKVCCFVTEHFAKPWLGGNQAIVQMNRLCCLKGAVVMKTGVINWTSRSRDIQIKDLTSNLSQI
jgi:menaquinone-dependent protoporphyrinogen IX oxidase